MVTLTTEELENLKSCLVTCYDHAWHDLEADDRDQAEHWIEWCEDRIEEAGNESI